MPGLSTDKQPGDVKVEMFGIETTEILSAHEDHKKQGVTPPHGAGPVHLNYA